MGLSSWLCIYFILGPLLHETVKAATRYNPACQNSKLQSFILCDPKKIFLCYMHWLTNFYPLSLISFIRKVTFTLMRHGTMETIAYVKWLCRSFRVETTINIYYVESCKTLCNSSYMGHSGVTVIYIKLKGILSLTFWLKEKCPLRTSFLCYRPVYEHTYRWRAFHLWNPQRNKSDIMNLKQSMQ